jgi:hypothetical protein
MNLFFFGAHNDPTLKETNQGGQSEYAGDPNFDESLNQGGEYMDDSLRMTDQPLADE